MRRIHQIPALASENWEIGGERSQRGRKPGRPVKNLGREPGPFTLAVNLVPEPLSR